MTNPPAVSSMKPEVCVAIVEFCEKQGPRAVHTWPSAWFDRDSEVAIMSSLIKGDHSFADEYPVTPFEQEMADPRLPSCCLGRHVDVVVKGIGSIPACWTPPQARTAAGAA